MNKKIKSLFSVVLSVCFAFTLLFALAGCGEHKHTLEHVESVAPTCTTAGNIEYWHCTDCEKNYDAEKNGKEIENIVWNALGHDFQYTYNAETKKYEGVCTRDSSHTDEINAGTESYPYLISAESDFAAVGLADEAATDTIYVKLADNVVISSGISAKRAFVLDLNNYNITLNTTEEATLLTIGNVPSKTFEVTIKNGKLVLNSSSARAKNLITCDYNSRLTLDNVEGESTQNGITIWEYAHVTVLNSKITSKFMAVSTNNGGTNDVHFTATNSKFYSSEDTALFSGGYMVANISDCELVGKTGGMHIMMGEYNISGTQIASTAETFTARTAENIAEQGTNYADGAAIAIRADLYYDKGTKTNRIAFNLTNCTIGSANGTRISIYDCKDKKGDLAKVEDKTTIMNQTEYVLSYFANEIGVKTFEYDSSTNTIVETTK